MGKERSQKSAVSSQKVAGKRTAKKAKAVKEKPGNKNKLAAVRKKMGTAPIKIVYRPPIDITRGRPEERVQRYMEVPLEMLVSNPMNPRKRFDGTKFDELVASIRAKGILEPILVRPIDGGKKFEIVAGERRFRAACQVAKDNGGMKGRTAPAMIRELNDDEAFDCMTIENLQREDLTELEEAESFKAYQDRRGEGSLVELAEKTGINITYIRRRVAILDLPEPALKSWEKGKIKYGHLEQLRRLTDENEIKERLKKVVDWGTSVRDLKESIDEHSPALKDALFDIEKAGCPGCQKNTDVQKRLFNFDGMDGAHCIDPGCFKQNLNNFLQADWKKTKYRRQYGTNGFRFDVNINWGDFQDFYGKGFERCRECPNYVTIIRIDGTARNGRVCVGDKKCFGRGDDKKPQTMEESMKEGLDMMPEEKASPAWHGSYFREEFYKGILPKRLAATAIDGVEMERIQLFSLIKSNQNGLRNWFAKSQGIIKKTDEGDEEHEDLHAENGGKDLEAEAKNIQPGEDIFEMENDPVETGADFDEEDEGDDYDIFGGPFIQDEKIWEAICAMDYLQARECLRDASIAVVMQTEFGAKARRMVADHIGISLKDEWRITQEYLDKKTKAEMFAIADQFKLFEDQKAKTFLFEKLLKKRGNFNSCKKDELIRVFLESGVELAGVVPEEILKD